MSATEGGLVRAVLEALKWRRDVDAWRQNTGAVKFPGARGERDRFVRFGVPGCADVTGLLDGGRRLEIELKLKGQKQQSRAQLRFQRRIEDRGGLYVLAYDVDDVLRALDAHKGLIR